MDDKAFTTQAEAMLKNLLEWQPQLFSGVTPTETSGEALAAFCDAFIRKYSALRASKTGPSRP